MIEKFYHVGISVVNLEESIKFYTKVMEMEIDYIAYHSGKKISRVVDVENAVLNICVVKKDIVRIELIEYENKEKENLYYKEQYEPGLIHIAFLVSDIDKEYDRIKSMGYVFYSPPMITRENGPKICYFKGPDNVIIELYEKIC